MSSHHTQTSTSLWNGRTDLVAVFIVKVHFSREIFIFTERSTDINIYTDDCLKNSSGKKDL